jgi:hypothetical protein
VPSWLDEKTFIFQFVMEILCDTATARSASGICSRTFIVRRTKAEQSRSKKHRRGVGCSSLIGTSATAAQHLSTLHKPIAIAREEIRSIAVLNLKSGNGTWVRRSIAHQQRADFA